MCRKGISCWNLLFATVFLSVLGSFVMPPFGLSANKDEEDPEDEWIYAPVYGTILMRREVDWNSKDAKNRCSMSETSRSHALIRFTGVTEYEEDGEKMYKSSALVTYRISAESTMITYDEEGKEDSRMIKTSRGDFNDRSTFETQVLQVNPVLKKFRLSVPTVEAKGQSEETFISAAGKHSEKRPDKFMLTLKDFPREILKGVIKEASYDPKSGRIIGDLSRTVYTAYVMGSPLDYSPNLQAGDPYLSLMRAQEGAWIKPVRLSLQWNLSMKPQQAKLEIKGENDYDTWLPDPEKAPLKITAKITEPKDAKGIIRVKFQHVSKEPGECMNFPANAKNDNKPDLQFALDSGGKTPVKILKDGQEAEAEEKANEVTLLVKTTDFGAYGKIIAEADVTTSSGQENVTSMYNGKSGELPYLPVPRDENDNHVADKWEEDMQSGANAGADEDMTPGAAYQGDGLTVYEEYRGFRVKGKHVRTKPRVKDLFIWDPDNLVTESAVMRGAFGDLVVHLVTAEEMNLGRGGGMDRVVNFNYGQDYHEVDQHGLRIAKNTAQLGDYGRALDSYYVPPGTTTCGPPAETDIVYVFITQIRQSLERFVGNNKAELQQKLGRPVDDAWIEAKRLQMIDYVTTHEVGHGIGINHHDPTDASPYTCPIFYPDKGLGPAPSFMALLLGGFPNAYCGRCLNWTQVSDKHRAGQ